MKTFFMDTSYIIALEAADDKNHKSAVRHWRDLNKPLPLFVTTTYVFDEVVTFFNNQNRHAKAVEIGERLLTSPSVQFIHVDETLFYETWDYFKQHTDKSYSLTDCISFVVMKRLGIQTSLSFDKHFVQAGFEKLP